jgi:hypothetical protein
MGGISASTATQLLYGTDGYVTVAGTDLGSTTGDIAIEWSLTQYYPNIAQARGPVMGTGRVTEGKFSVKVTILEWTYAVLNKYIGSWGYSTSANSERLGGGSLKYVTEVSNVQISGMSRNDQKAILVTLPQAYIELGGVSFAEDKETSLEVTFNGLFTTSSPTTLPGYIDIAK